MGNSLSLNADYTVHVKTGHYFGAGTDANVSIVLCNGSGERSPSIPLKCFWRNNFERDREDKFHVSDLPNFGPVKTIELGHDGAGLLSDWYVEYVTVTNLSNKENYIFPVQRWITDKALVVSEFDYCLPQDDPFIEQRKQELAKRKQLYEFEAKSEGLPVQVKECPSDEAFSSDYKYGLTGRKMKLLIQSKITNITTSPWETLDDLINVYRKDLPQPDGVKNWKKDIEFGMQRLSGCNPTMIRLCTTIPENLGVTNEMMKPVLEDLDLEEAISQKRLYIMDLGVLKDLKCTDDRKVCSPIALFFVNNEKKFLPVAIQLQQEKGENNPVFLPTDPEYTWMLAKMYFNNADASIHQACTHLAFTHLLMESVAVCTNRNLSPSHPLYRLLAPHFLYLLAINSRALAKLVAPGEWVDRCMTSGRIGMFGIIARMFKDWRMDVEGTLPRDLEERGVADPEVLPDYHYRDDAMLSYNAIKNYVTMVVEEIYDDPEKIAQDYELQAWGQEMTAPIPDGMGIKGVPGNGHFTTVEEIVQTLTSITFISSVGHAAANFAQYDEYGFPPNYPAILRGDPPTTKEPLTEKAILDQLPNKKTTIETMVITKILSDRGTKPLADFEIKYQYHPIGEKAVQEFMKELEEIGKIIDERNKTRSNPYIYLNPREIPNAISI